MSLNRLKKRFDFEITLLNNIENIFVDECQDLNEGLEIFYFTKKYVMNIKLLFSNRYPFTPPNVKLISIENTDYIEFLCNVSCHFKDLRNEECLCCNSIVCKNNWGPQIHLVEIIREIMQITNNCELEINKNIKKSIYLKYLGYDIS